MIDMDFSAMPARTFEIMSDGGVLARDPQTGTVLATRPATGTAIVQLLPLGLGVVVREDYYHYPRATSNLYYLDAALREVWRAERPSLSDVYTSVSERDGLLCGFTWDCWDCDLDPASGRLLRKVWTK